MKKYLISCALCFGLMLAVLASTPSLHAADKTWSGTTDQTWNTGTNWGGTAPVNADRLLINLSTGNYPVVTAGSTTFNSGDISLGTAAGNVGRLDVTSGTITLNVIGTTGNWVFVGGNLANAAGGTGTLNIADTAGTGGTLTGFAQGSGGLTIGKLWVGGRDNNSGTGIVNINTTGTINAQSTASGLTASIIVGAQGSTGTLNLDNGIVQANGRIVVGRISGTGNFTMSGGTVTTAGLEVAWSAANTNTAKGTVTINGGTLTSSEDVVIGLGGNTTAKGTLVLNGGTLNVATGTEKWMKVGAFDTVAGQVDINSGFLNLNTNSDIRFNGNSGAGTSVINQNGGNVVSYSDNGITLGGNTVLDMKQSGTAGDNTYNLNGGTLAISQVMSTVANGSRTFNFNGGTLKVASNANAATFFNLGTGTTRTNVRNAGALLDTNGINVTVAQSLLHSNVGGDADTDGGLTKLGLGTLTMTGANTYNGVTTVSAGQLMITGSIASNGPAAILITAPDDDFLSGTANPVLSRRVAATTSFTLGSLTGQGATAVSTDPVTLSSLNTTASILAGTASVDRDVTMAWRTRTIAEAAGSNPTAVLSDVVNLNGTGTDVFLLEMSYNDLALSTLGLSEASIAASGELRLGWKNGSTWVTAVNGNSSGMPTFEGNVTSADFLTIYGGSLTSKLGSYGVDTANNKVWAVLDHNSEFAVIPEPSTLVIGGLMLLGLTGLGLRRHRQRA